jgi:hypothetical protein
MLSACFGFDADARSCACRLRIQWHFFLMTILASHPSFRSSMANRFEAEG